MAEVNTPEEIIERWGAEGRTFRMADVQAEVKRQGREALREREDATVAAAELPDATEHTRNVAKQILDHRAAGNYTTQG